MTRAPEAGTSAAAIPRVSIGWIHPFLEILDEGGADFDGILERVSLPTLAVDDPSILVPTASVYSFVYLAARETGLDDLGIQAGTRFRIEALLPDAERSWTRPGVFRSLESFINAALESSSDVEMWIGSRSDPMKTAEFYYLGTFGSDHPAFPIVEQFMIALMVRWIRYGAGPGWNPTQVNFRSASAPEDSIRKLVGDASVRFHQSVTSVVFPSHQFLGPMDRFPEEGSAIWKRHLGSLGSRGPLDDLAASLRIILPAYLPDGSPDIRQAARLAGTSVRTLQRRLSEEGLTYSQLLEDLRHDLAIYLLRDPNRQASEVSRELGFRDPAIFTRAFRRWTGTTPSEFRRSFSVQ